MPSPVFHRIGWALVLVCLPAVGQVASIKNAARQFPQEPAVVEVTGTEATREIDGLSTPWQESTSTSYDADGGSSTTEIPAEGLRFMPFAFPGLCAGPDTGNGSGFPPQSGASGDDPPATPMDKRADAAKIQPSVEVTSSAKPGDFNRDIYFEGKREFSLEGGWLPINVPFPLDVFEGDPYNLYPLRYTLVPIFASLRWHLSDIAGPVVLRGNWDMTFTGSATAIPRGPETRYFSYVMGVRRNFVPRNWRVAPYWDLQLGLGDINAKGGVHGIKYAQGEDFTFTLNMGAGVRYNLNPRYAITGGLHYMHISNAGISGKKTNYGINVYGPMIGIDIQVHRHARGPG